MVANCRTKASLVGTEGVELGSSRDGVVGLLDSICRPRSMPWWHTAASPVLSAPPLSTCERSVSYFETIAGGKSIDAIVFGVFFSAAMLVQCCVDVFAIRILLQQVVPIEAPEWGRLRQGANR